MGDLNRFRAQTIGTLGVLICLILCGWLGILPGEKAIADDKTEPLGNHDKKLPEWKAWPGGNAVPSLNPVETINSTDLGFTGNVSWTVQGGTIISHTPADGNQWSQIVVRYDTRSTNNTFDAAAEIKAYTNATNAKTIRRTIFGATWQPPNTNQHLFNVTATLRDNLLFADNITGGPFDVAGFIWEGQGNPAAHRTAAKIECIVCFFPNGIDWKARGVTWKYGADGGGAKFDCRIQRKRMWTMVGQSPTDANRKIQKDDSDWVYDEASTYSDTQNPTS